MFLEDGAGGMHLSDDGSETECFEGEKTQIPRALPTRVLESITTRIALKHSDGSEAQERTDLGSCLTSHET